MVQSEIIVMCSLIKIMFTDQRLTLVQPIYFHLYTEIQGGGLYTENQGKVVTPANFFYLKMSAKDKWTITYKP